MRWCLPLLASLLLAASPVRPIAVTPPPAQWRSVLVAGDGSLPVFDNATDAMAARLHRWGSPPAMRLSGAPAMLDRPGTLPATRTQVLVAVGGLHAGPGEGCLVFATSHGVRRQGLYLSLRDEALAPAALDAALERGCGARPTVVIVSSCFSGSFALPPMTRDNRVVITAARPDRTSFGCQAGRTYTVFDACLLAALDRGGTWPQAFGVTRACVGAEEARERVRPSEPQAWFGRGMAGLEVP